MKIELTAENYPEHYQAYQELLERIKSHYGENCISFSPKIFIDDSGAKTAAATLKGNIAIHPTALDQITVEEFEGIVAHELGHLFYKDNSEILNVIISGDLMEREKRADEFARFFSSNNGQALADYFKKQLTENDERSSSGEVRVFAGFYEAIHGNIHPDVGERISFFESTDEISAPPLPAGNSCAGIAKE